MLNKRKKIEKYNFDNKFSIDEAISIVKDITSVKFDSSLDLSINFDLVFKKSECILEDSIFFPHGTGNRSKILVICTPEEEGKIKNLDVDYFGLESYLKKIKNG